MQAYHKSVKAKAIKKGKASTLKARQEKLSKRNPFRLAARIEELKLSDRPHDQKLVAELEKELAAVKKAREASGIKDDWDRDKRRQEQRMGKGEEQRLRRERRERGNEIEKAEESDSGESTCSSVRDIPLPPGPLPPLPGEEPPKQEVKTTYESAPVMRDLRKEAAAFVPTAVKRKLAEQQQSQDKKPKPETGDHSESGVKAEATTSSGASQTFIPSLKVNAAPEVVDDELQRFQAEVEEVQDEDDYR